MFPWVEVHILPQSQWFGYSYPYSSTGNYELRRQNCAYLCVQYHRVVEKQARKHDPTSRIRLSVSCQTMRNYVSSFSVGCIASCVIDRVRSQSATIPWHFSIGAIPPYCSEFEFIELRGYWDERWTRNNDSGVQGPHLYESKSPNLSLFKFPLRSIEMMATLL